MLAPTTGSKRQIFLLGADRFIDLHIATRLRQHDHQVTASARRGSALAQMGFTTFHADLDATSQPLCKKCLRYYRIWFTLGWPAFIALMGIFWLMISKPQL